jgi:hypothetical protein
MIDDDFFQTSYHSLIRGDHWVQLFSALPFLQPLDCLHHLGYDQETHSLKEKMVKLEVIKGDTMEVKRKKTFYFDYVDDHDVQEKNVEFVVHYYKMVKHHQIVENDDVMFQNVLDE